VASVGLRRLNVGLPSPVPLSVLPALTAKFKLIFNWDGRRMCFGLVEGPDVGGVTNDMCGLTPLSKSLFTAISVVILQHF